MKSFIPAILWASIILALSVMHAPDVPDPISRILSKDKFGHAGVYFVLTGLLGWAFHRNGDARALLSAGIAALYGVGVELVQYGFFPHRHFELLDIIANIIGSIAGLFALNFFLK